MKEESRASSDYRLGKVEKVFVGEDGHVRRAVIMYKILENPTSEGRRDLSTSSS